MKISRREFIRKMVTLGFSTVTAGTLFSLLACGREEMPMPTNESPISPESKLPPTLKPSISPNPSLGGTYLAVTRGESPVELVEAAIKALGGMEHFVKSGNDVAPAVIAQSNDECKRHQYKVPRFHDSKRDDPVR